MHISEAQVLRAVRDLLAAEGWTVIRLHAGLATFPSGAIRHMNAEGTPDLIAVRPKRAGVLWIEVKRPGGHLRPAQKDWHAAAQRAGYTVLVVDDVNVLRDWLHEAGA